MRTKAFFAAPVVAALAIACAHDRATNAPPQTEITSAPVAAPQPPLYAPPGTEMEQNTTGTDLSPGSSSWGTSGSSGTRPPVSPPAPSAAKDAGP